jgi:hypothetical protein
MHVVQPREVRCESDVHDVADLAELLSSAHRGERVALTGRTIALPAAHNLERALRVRWAAVAMWPTPSRSASGHPASHERLRLSSAEGTMSQESLLGCAPRLASLQDREGRATPALFCVSRGSCTLQGGSVALGAGADAALVFDEASTDLVLQDVTFSGAPAHVRTLRLSCLNSVLLATPCGDKRCSPHLAYATWPVG